MKRKRFISISLILLTLALIMYALIFEEHTVALFDGNTREQVGGDKYVDSIESGQLLRRDADGKLYNAKSLTPDAAKIDDCPT